ncbi:MAG: DUF4145 domain-containing protein [Thermodesulfobacteriales bacterium]|nr:MAG: DUF4145 domain-containing protein [Thermodesulfobacteriales bacterium]
MGRSAEKEIRCVAFCPHCNNRAPQTLVHTQEFETTVPSGAGDEETEIVAHYYVVSCDTCKGILIYADVFTDGDETNFIDYFLVWPEKKTLPFPVPKHIKQIYEEAVVIQKASPDAFAVQIRRGLEAICIDRGIKEKNLQAALKRLAEKGEIPKVLAEVTDVLRLLGNVGAHWTGQHVHPSQTPALDDFFKAIVEYIYVAPNKLLEFKNQLEEFKKVDSDKK